MKVADLLRCARPLIFKNEDIEFRYGIKGTCFVAFYKANYYVITSRHCLHHNTWENVCVGIEPGKLNFFKFDEFYLPAISDPDYSDMAVARIFPDAVAVETLKEGLCLDLENYSKKSLPNQNEKSQLVLVGCPTERNSVDYEKREVWTGGFSTDGHYAGRAEEPNCSKIRFNNLNKIKDLDGLSGSPMFHFINVLENKYEIYFSGVFIRGTQSSSLGRYINAEIVYAMLDTIVRRKLRS